MPVNYGSQIDEHHAVRRDAGMFDVSHMRVVDLDGDARRAATFLRYALANNVDKLKMPGKALYSCLLRRRRRRARRPDRLFPARGFLPPRRQRGDRRQGHRVARARSRRSAPGVAHHAARRPRDDRRAGPERAREGLAGAARHARPRRAALEAVQRGDRRDASGELFIARTGYTGEDGFEIIVPADATPRRCGTRCARPASRRAASARATRCASKPA